MGLQDVRMPTNGRELRMSRYLGAVRVSASGNPDRAATEARCVTCGHVFEEGDRYIEDTSSGFVGAHADPSVDDLMADLFGGIAGKVLMCEGCTEPSKNGYKQKVWPRGR